MHATALPALLAGALVLSAAAQAQPAPPAGPDRATTATRLQVAPDVTLHTRVADPAMVRASRAFDALDRDGDGVVGRGEATAEAALAAEFDAVDGDGNGRIDRDEYTARLRR